MLTVERVHWYSGGVFEIQFQRNGIEFFPGDCLALFAADETTSRPYSVSSGMGEDLIRFVIRRMPDGAVSTYLSERRPGDRVKASPPFGWFRPGQHPEFRFVFIATGTGISPFLSHLRSRPENPPILCLFGARKAADAVEVDWLKRQCDLRLAISREKVVGAHHGRVTELLEEIPIESTSHYYLCGLDAMIDEVMLWLENRGVALTQVHCECFFSAAG